MKTLICVYATFYLLVKVIQQWQDVNIFEYPSKPSTSFSNKSLIFRHPDGDESPRV